MCDFSGAQPTQIKKTGEEQNLGGPLRDRTEENLGIRVGKMRFNSLMPLVIFSL